MFHDCVQWKGNDCHLILITVDYRRNAFASEGGRRFTNNSKGFHWVSLKGGNCSVGDVPSEELFLPSFKSSSGNQTPTAAVAASAGEIQALRRTRQMDIGENDWHKDSLTYLLTNPQPISWLISIITRPEWNNLNENYIFFFYYFREFNIPFSLVSSFSIIVIIKFEFSPFHSRLFSRLDQTKTIEAFLQFIIISFSVNR